MFRTGEFHETDTGVHLLISGSVRTAVRWCLSEVSKNSRKNQTIVQIILSFTDHMLMQLHVSVLSVREQWREFQKLSTAGSIQVQCHLHSTTIHLRIKNYSSSSSQLSSYLKLLTRQEDGSTHYWLSQHCSLTKLHMRMLSFSDMFRMQMDRRWVSQRVTLLTHLTHYRSMVLTQSVGTSTRIQLLGFLTDSRTSGFQKVRESSWEHSGTHMHSSYCMLILMILMLLSISLNMTSSQLWTNGYYQSLILWLNSLILTLRITRLQRLQERLRTSLTSFLTGM